jgi:glutamine amidotransferase
VLRELATHGSRTGLNFLLSNGKPQAHASTQALIPYSFTLRRSFAHPAGRRRQHHSPTTKLAPFLRGAVVMTPLTTNETWTALSPGELEGFVDAMDRAGWLCCARKCTKTPTTFLSR